MIRCFKKVKIFQKVTAINLTDQYFLTFPFRKCKIFQKFEQIIRIPDKYFLNKNLICAHPVPKIFEPDFSPKWRKVHTPYHFATPLPVSVPSPDPQAVAAPSLPFGFVLLCF